MTYYAAPDANNDSAIWQHNENKPSLPTLILEKGNLPDDFWQAILDNVCENITPCDGCGYGGDDTRVDWHNGLTLCDDCEDEFGCPCRDCRYVDVD